MIDAASAIDQVIAIGQDQEHPVAKIGGGSLVVGQLYDLRLARSMCCITGQGLVEAVGDDLTDDVGSGGEIREGILPSLVDAQGVGVVETGDHEWLARRVERDVVQNA